MNDSVIPCDEVTESYNEETKAVPTNFNEKKATWKTQNFYILLAFLLITIALLIAISIYCYLIKYRAKQKHFLPFDITNNELKEIMYQQYKSKMSEKVKDISTKSHAYCFFDYITNTRKFDRNNIKIGEKSYKNILIYYNGYVTIKYSKYVKINSVNPSLFSTKWMYTLKKLMKISIWR